MKQVFFLLSAILFMAACASSGISSQQSRRVGTYEEKFVNARFDNSEIAHKQLLDMNRDLVVDLWKFYVNKKSSDEEKGELILVRKEVDGNFDGRVDSILYYNDHEELIREEMDTDFDGYVDAIRYYANAQLAKVENYDSEKTRFQIDGEPRSSLVPASTRYYRKGVLTREELDDDLDGRLNTVIVFDATGKIVQKGFDQTGDGQIDAWERY